MAKKKGSKEELTQVQVTKECLIYFHQRKRNAAEPLYRVVDRILHEYVTKELAAYAARADAMEKINVIYLERIHRLEEQIKEREQMKLV